MKTRYQKVADSLREHFAINGHPMTGKPGRPQTPEENAKRSATLKATLALKPKKTEQQQKARNKANVYAYRARKMNAIPHDADLALIKRIYENCLDGFHVDHRIALANGGLHHQDNLQYLPISENCRKGKGNSYNESLAIQWSDWLARQGSNP